MRLFIAIELEEETKKHLQAIQEELKIFIIKGNYTAVDNFHVTLRFLGETDERKLGSLEKVIDETARRTKPFMLNLYGIGHFPKKQREVIWVGIDGQLESVQKLKKYLELELEKIGVTRERFDYTPHITLVRNAKISKPVEFFHSKVSIPSTLIKVKSLSLMESIRIDDKLVYRPIYVKKLGNNE